MASEKAKWKVQMAVCSLKEALEFSRDSERKNLFPDSRQHDFYPFRGLIRSDKESGRLIPAFRDDSSNENIPPSDLIEVALHLPSVAHQGAVELVKLLNDGVIFDRAAVHCIAHIRLFLQQQVADARSHDVESNCRKKGELRNELIDLVNVCLACINPSQEKAQSSRSSTTSLELLPYIIEMLGALSTDGAIKIIDHIFDMPWPPNLTLKISNLINDLVPFLNSTHFNMFKNKLSQSASSINQDDMAGIVRICIYIFQIRNYDMGWLNLLRQLHFTIQSSSNCSQAAEGLLEQSLSSVPQNVCSLIVEILENESLRQFQCVIHESYTEKCEMDGYFELDGSPIICPSDVKLMLLLFRTARSCDIGSSGAGVAGSFRHSDSQPSCDFPSVLTEGQCFFYVCCRSLFVMVLISAMDSLLTKAKTGSLNESRMWLAKLFSDPDDDERNREIVALLSVECEKIIIQCINAACDDFIPASDSSEFESISSSRVSMSWVASARARDIVDMLVQLLVNEALTSPCLIAIERILRLPHIRSSDNAFHKRSKMKCSFLLNSSLSACLEAVFGSVPDSERTILSTIVSTIISSSAQSINQNRLSATTTIIDKDTKENAPKRKGQALVEVFQALVSRFPRKVIEHCQLLHGYVSTLSLLCVRDVAGVLSALSTLCGKSRLLYSALLSLHRKSLLHQDERRRAFAIESLVGMLADVNSSSQSEIIHILLHVLHLPLHARRTLYAVLLHHLGSTSPHWRSRVDSSVLLVLLENLRDHVESCVGNRETWSSDGHALKICPIKFMEIAKDGSTSSLMLLEDVEGLVKVTACLEVYVDCYRNERSIDIDDNVPQALQCIEHLISTVIAIPGTASNVLPSDTVNALLTTARGSSGDGSRIPFTSTFVRRTVESIKAGFHLSEVTRDDEEFGIRLFASYLCIETVVGILRICIEFYGNIQERSYVKIEGYEEAMLVLFIAQYSIYEMLKEKFELQSFRQFTRKVSIESFRFPKVHCEQTTTTNVKSKSCEDNMTLLHYFVIKANESRQSAYHNPAMSFSLLAGAISIVTSAIEESFQGFSASDLKRNSSLCESALRSITRAYMSLCTIEMQSSIIKDVQSTLQVKDSCSSSTRDKKRGVVKRKTQTKKTPAKRLQSELSDEEEDQWGYQDDRLEDIPNNDKPKRSVEYADNTVAGMLSSLPIYVFDALRRADWACIASRCGNERARLACSLPSKPRRGSDVTEALQAVLFRLRCNVLEAMGTVAASGVSTGATWKRSLDIDHFLCAQLLSAVEQGLSVRSFLAFNKTIRKLWQARYLPFDTRDQSLLVASHLQSATKDLSGSSIGLLLLQSMEHLHESTPPQLFRDLLGTFLRLRPVKGCEVVLVALSEVLCSRRKVTALESIFLKGIKQQAEYPRLLRVLEKTPKIIEVFVLDVLSHMNSLLSMCLGGDLCLCTCVEGLSSASVSDLLLLPLLSEVGREVQSSPRIKKKKDTLLCLEAEQTVDRTGTVGGDTSTVADTPTGDSSSGAGAESGKVLCMMDVFSEKHRRKYFTILGKFFRCCNKECASFFKHFKKPKSIGRERSGSMSSESEPGSDSSDDERDVHPENSEETSLSLESYCLKHVTLKKGTFPPFPTFLVDVLDKTKLLAGSDSNCALVYALSKRESLRSIIPHGNSAATKIEELSINVKDRLREWMRISPSRKKEIYEELNPHAIQCFQLFDRNGRTLFDALIAAGQSMTSGIGQQYDLIETNTKRTRKKRLRSRNTVIDEWLEGEDGTDTFVDLEDFLVH